MRHPPSSRFRASSAATLSLLLAIAGCGAASGEDGGDAGREVTDPASPSGEDARRQRRAPLQGTAWVIFGPDTVVAEVARTTEERARGLMYREEVPDGTGMLFVFDEPEVRSFWMENTYVPLDIAFIDASFRIIDVQRMEPRTTEYHESDGPALFALEVRAGWFGEHGIDVGDTAEIVFGG